MSIFKTRAELKISFQENGLGKSWDFLCVAKALCFSKIGLLLFGRDSLLIGEVYPEYSFAYRSHRITFTFLVHKTKATLIDIHDPESDFNQLTKGRMTEEVEKHRPFDWIPSESRQGNLATWLSKFRLTLTHSAVIFNFVL
ncbi:hypothetical protein J6590_008944 [Homalodisca vitripennis]|nr:hypothetical protein J6590_008944 [Homalodisca vitripennis]